GVREQPLDAAPVEPRDGLRVEFRERLPVVLALAQDRDPGEAGLRALEQEEFEQLAVVVQRNAPLGVVVFDVERILSDPVASLHRRPSRSIASARATSRVTLSSAPCAARRSTSTQRSACDSSLQRSTAPPSTANP